MEWLHVYPYPAGRIDRVKAYRKPDKVFRPTTTFADRPLQGGDGSLGGLYTGKGY